MSRSVRLGVFAAGAIGFALLFVLAALALPHFGASFHPYGRHAARAAVGHATANTVMSVTLDQRGIDTFGEEIILFSSVLGASVLLRARNDETEDASIPDHARGADVPDNQAILAAGWLALPVAMLIGIYLVAHGHLSPGGGFQGGVTLATALHLIYLAGSYPALKRIRPPLLYEAADAAGALAYAVLGLAVMLTGAAFLTNVIPGGRLTSFVSAGTVPILNFGVGVEVGSAFVMLIAEFLDQVLVIRRKTDAECGAEGQ